MCILAALLIYRIISLRFLPQRRTSDCESLDLSACYFYWGRLYFTLRALERLPAHAKTKQKLGLLHAATIQCDVLKEIRKEGQNYANKETNETSHVSSCCDTTSSRTTVIMIAMPVIHRSLGTERQSSVFSQTFLTLRWWRCLGTLWRVCVCVSRGRVKIGTNWRLWQVYLKIKVAVKCEKVPRRQVVRRLVNTLPPLQQALAAKKWVQSRRSRRLQMCAPVQACLTVRSCVAVCWA